MRKNLSTTIRKEIYEKTGGHCAYCGIPLETAVVEKVIKPLYNFKAADA
jgi:hypothetical protein